MKTPVVHPVKVLKALNKAGFKQIRSRGDHIILSNGTRQVVVQYRGHGREIPAGSMKQIIRDSGLTTEEFCKLLKK